MSPVSDVRSWDQNMIKISGKGRRSSQGTMLLGEDRKLSGTRNERSSRAFPNLTMGDGSND
jgi:hypothetical protein